MKSYHYHLPVFILLLLVTTTIEAQEKKPKAPTANKVAEPAAQPKKKEWNDSVRVSKEIDAEKKHKHADSLRIEKIAIVEKHKHMDSLRIDKNAAAERKHKHADSLKNINREIEKTHKQAPSKKHLENVKSKKVVMSVPCKPGATLILSNIMHRITVLTTDNDKVTMVATVHYTGQSSLTDEEWFSKMELTLVQEGDHVDVSSSGSFPESKLVSHEKFDLIYNGALIFDSVGNAIALRTSSDPDLLLYVPKDIRVNLESKHGDITFENNMRSIEAKMTNGRLSLANVDQLRVIVSYVRVDIGRAKQAEIEIKNAQLRARDVTALVLTSGNSSVLLDKVDSLHIRNSQADYYQIKEAGHVEGNKYFGDMQLLKLKGSIDIDGQNTSIMLGCISPSVRLVKINSQYADLRLSVDELKNYIVAFEGKGGKVVAPFKKTNVSQTVFNSSTGNVKNNPTVFQLRCNDCLVNFN